MEHKEIVRELIAVGISLNIREINYNEAVDLINKNLLEYSKLNNLSLTDVSQQRELLLAYHRYLTEELSLDLHEIWVDEHLKANNCG
jgi:hypothetical protein